MKYFMKCTAAVINIIAGLIVIAFNLLIVVPLVAIGLTILTIFQITAETTIEDIDTDIKLALLIRDLIVNKKLARDFINKEIAKQDYPPMSMKTYNSLLNEKREYNDAR